MSYFRVNSPNVIHEIIDGEAVLVNLETGSYYSMDRVAAVVWEYVEKGFSSDQIVEAIAAQYDGERVDIDKGIQSLLNELQTVKLIVHSEATSARPAMPAAHEAAKGTTKSHFEALGLHKYTDMEDLLLSLPSTMWKSRDGQTPIPTMNEYGSPESTIQLGWSRADAVRRTRSPLKTWPAL